MSVSNDTFAIRAKMECVKQGLSHRELSVISGIPYWTIAGWFRKTDPATPSYANKVVIASVLGIPVDEPDKFCCIDKDILRDNVRLLMAVNFISSRDLAANLGIRESTVTSWWSKKSGISVETIPKIAKFFRVDPDDLFNPDLITVTLHTTRGDVDVIT